MGIIGDYVSISKPRIMVSLLLVAWAAMFVAADGLPALLPFAAVTLGGILSTASSGAFNHVLERKRDAKMKRTANRPLVSGRISVFAGSLYASLCAVGSVLALWLPGYELAALLNLGAIVYYVVIYTAILKPTTPQNVVIGGFAGSFPALIGWAAVAGTLGWGAWILAAILFAWSPAHFWALALMYKDDYAKGGYPMMPNVRGDASTLRQIVVYAVLTATVSLGLYFVGASGLVYVVASAALGVVLVARSVRLLGNPEPKRIRSFFFFTIQYLALLMAVAMLDQVLPSIG